MHWYTLLQKNVYICERRKKMMGGKYSDAINMCLRIRKERVNLVMFSNYESMNESSIFNTICEIEHDPTQLKCSARITIHPNKTCTKNISAHSTHGDHELRYREMITKNKIKNRIERVAKDMPPGSSHLIPKKRIFNDEINK